MVRPGLVVGLALLLVGGLVPGGSLGEVGVAAAAAADGAVMPFDFDGDGYADLAVGVPFEDLRGRRDAGSVQVLYGSVSGPTTRDQMWHQGRKGVKGALEAGDQFGSRLSSGDFDGDGYADLAIGIPNEDLSGHKDVGAVPVLYGGPKGLTRRDQVWHQGSRGVPGSNEAGDNFGWALAAGDFDHDGFSDLAIGAMGESVGDAPMAGAVVVLRGSRSGFRHLQAQCPSVRARTVCRASLKRMSTSGTACLLVM